MIAIISADILNSIELRFVLNSSFSRYLKHRIDLGKISLVLEVGMTRFR